MDQLHHHHQQQYQQQQQQHGDFPIDVEHDNHRPAVKAEEFDDASNVSDYTYDTLDYWDDLSKDYQISPDEKAIAHR